MLQHNYIGLRLRCGTREIDKLDGYLIARQNDKVVRASCIVGYPPQPGFIACYNIEVLKPKQLEKIVREIKEFLPEDIRIHTSHLNFSSGRFNRFK